MKSAPERVKCDALPEHAQAQLKRFLFAYRLPESGRFVIRHVDPTTRVMHELEFDPKLDRFLSQDERLQVGGSGEARSYVLPGLVAWVSYHIHPERQTLVAHFDVFESDSGHKFIEERACYRTVTRNLLSFYPSGNSAHRVGAHVSRRASV